MHQDSKRLKAHRTGINLDEYEDNLIDALVDYTGIEKATLLRQMVMREALEMLGVRDIHEFDAVSIAVSNAIPKLH
ncbi:hypothetical protein [Salinicola sp. RZ23]|uniref:hypothetical protein n=1 Tax=Salinicola sp. RZ23 TaxID=1949087 RepID=UPI000DA1DA43|nr:hypothetical protein [Salinicola sp. RZ23]